MSLVAELAQVISRHVVYTETIPSPPCLCQLASRDLLKFLAFLRFNENSRGGLGGTLSSSLSPAINSLELSPVCFSSPPANVKLHLHLAPCLCVLVTD